MSADILKLILKLLPILLIIVVINLTREIIRILTPLNRSTGPEVLPQCRIPQNFIPTAAAVPIPIPIQSPAHPPLFSSQTKCQHRICSTILFTYVHTLLSFSQLSFIQAIFLNEK
jgi:hypothetical protein